MTTDAWEQMIATSPAICQCALAEIKENVQRLLSTAEEGTFVRCTAQTTSNTIVSRRGASFAESANNNNGNSNNTNNNKSNVSNKHDIGSSDGSTNITRRSPTQGQEAQTLAPNHFIGTRGSSMVATAAATTGTTIATRNGLLDANAEAPTKLSEDDLPAGGARPESPPLSDICPNGVRALPVKPRGNPATEGATGVGENKEISPKTHAVVQHEDRDVVTGSEASWSGSDFGTDDADDEEDLSGHVLLH